MQYPLPEGLIETPAPVLDQSMNVLVFQEPESRANYTIVINRDRMNAGETVERYCQRQIKTLGRQFDEYTVEQELVLHARESVHPYATFASRFRQSGTPVHQIQCAIRLADESGVIIFTLGSSAPFNEAQRAHHATVVSSFMNSMTAVIK
ncbi:DcrB-related protein [Paraburkholderia bonniea]|uniref:DcrB-related protein n=1 Tax=Paraburkholderia bonniea TaxID=2152891 RepID=UPI0015802ECD|nr:DcrB-related protein [Paraburkholderia bonniea]WJF92127.1 DcrB-related protein [Paraburkholderia bonniea]WJF95447.1 DcrB-related protein [Paraburkholderia bonniea]